jgi:hypothetical protein
MKLELHNMEQWFELIKKHSRWSNVELTLNVLTNITDPWYDNINVTYVQCHMHAISSNVQIW